MSTLGRNHSNVLAVISVSLKRLVSIVISKPTRSELRNAPSLVVRVAKHFTTSHHTTLIFAPRIQLHSPLQLANALPLKTQMRLLQKNLRGRTKQVQIQRQDHQPLLKRRLQLQVLPLKRIPFSFLPTSFPIPKKT